MILNADAKNDKIRWKYKKKSQRNNIKIDRKAESPKENWKDLENKLHQMLYD